MAARLVLAFMLVALAPRAAHADQQADIAAAQKLYDEGKRLYNVGKFDDAVVAFEKAYDLYRAPEFLFNIGQCYRNLRNFEKSIFVFESYLREKPSTDKRALVEELIAEMKLEVQRQREKQQQDEQDAQVLAKKQREAQLEVLERQKQADLERIERERQQRALVEEPGGKPVYKKWWFWTIAGGVAVAAVGGIVLASSGDELPSGSLGTIDGR
jgi:tetratricopeptide (TPR) repeat protein